MKQCSKMVLTAITAVIITGITPVFSMEMETSAASINQIIPVEKKFSFQNETCLEGTKYYTNIKLSLFRIDVIPHKEIDSDSFNKFLESVNFPLSEDDPLLNASLDENEYYKNTFRNGFKVGIYKLQFLAPNTAKRLLDLCMEKISIYSLLIAKEHKLSLKELFAYTAAYSVLDSLSKQIPYFSFKKGELLTHGKYHAKLELSPFQIDIVIPKEIDFYLFNEIFEAASIAPFSEYDPLLNASLKEKEHYENTFKENSFQKGLYKLQFFAPNTAKRLLDFCIARITLDRESRIILDRKKKYEKCDDLRNAYDMAFSVLNSLRDQIPAQQQDIDDEMRYANPKDKKRRTSTPMHIED